VPLRFDSPTGRRIVGVGDCQREKVYERGKPMATRDTTGEVLSSAFTFRSTTMMKVGRTSGCSKTDCSHHDRGGSVEEECFAASLPFARARPIHLPSHDVIVGIRTGTASLSWLLSAVRPIAKMSYPISTPLFSDKSDLGTAQNMRTNRGSPQGNLRLVREVIYQALHPSALLSLTFKFFFTFASKSLS
jgi:hypothetical protein